MNTRIKYQNIVNNKAFIFLLSGVIIFVAIFIFFTICNFDKQGFDLSSRLFPKVVSDDYYYYARMQEVENGFISLGNPYYYEHRDDTPLTIYLPDWLASIPLLFGFSLFNTILLNIFIWSLIFSMSSYVLLSIFGFSRVGAGIFSLFLLILSFNFIVRPVVLQTILPFFILTLASFYYWKNSNVNIVRKSLFLSTILSIDLYLYQHLAVFAYSFTMIFGLYLLFKKQFSQLYFLILSVLISLLIAIPRVIQQIEVSHHFAFRDAVLRIEEAFTRLPSFFVFLSGRWVAVSLLIWIFLYYYSVSLESKRISIFFILSGLALIASMLNNVFTGVRIELAEHIGRFITVWLNITLCAFIFLIYQEWENIKIARKIVLAGFVLILVVFIFGTVKDYERGYGSLINGITSAESLQKYNLLIEKLNEYDNDLVIMANEDISSLIPVYTNHYVLSSRDGNAYLLSQDEIIERYLISRVFEEMNVNDFVDEYSFIVGYGYEADFFKEHNRWVEFCNNYKLDALGINCGNKKNNIERADGIFFDDIYNKYQIIKNNYYTFLKKYSVDYIIIDVKDGWVINEEDTKNLSNFSKLIYDEGGFQIYQVN